MSQPGQTINDKADVPEVGIDYFEDSIDSLTEYSKTSLIGSIDAAISELERAKSHIERGMRVNSLGILQGKATEIDRKAGEYGLLLDIRIEYTRARPYREQAIVKALQDK